MKKKLYKKAEPKEGKKFPRNYRNIPEKLNKDEAVFFVGIISVLAAILIISLDLYSNFERQKSLTNEKIRVLNEVAFWQSEVKIRPDYRDAYLNLALLNFQLKNFEESRKNLNRSLELDPNFKEGRELERLLDAL